MLAFLTTYYNVTTTCYNLVQRGKHATEREQNAYTTLCYISATLWYVMIRCGTLWYVAAARHNEAQCDTTWRQRGITRLWSSVSRVNRVTAGLQRGDCVDSTWRQRDTTWHPAEIFIFFQNVGIRNGAQRRGQNVRLITRPLVESLIHFPANNHLPELDVCCVVPGNREPSYRCRNTQFYYFL